VNRRAELLERLLSPSLSVEKRLLEVGLMEKEAKKM
jgi:hypothetical protein